MRLEDIRVEIIRSNRKTVALEVTPQCQVRVRAPFGMPEAEIRRFVQEKSVWILKHLAVMEQKAGEMKKNKTFIRKGTGGSGGSGLPGDSGEGEIFCIESRRDLRENYDPEPENPLGKLQCEGESELQLSSDAGSGGSAGLCGGS